VSSTRFNMTETASGVIATADARYAGSATDVLSKSR
jgi:hypothetical protein